VRLSGPLEETFSLSTDISESNEYVELVLWLLARVRISEYLSCRGRPEPFGKDSFRIHGVISTLAERGDVAGAFRPARALDLLPHGAQGYSPQAGSALVTINDVTNATVARA
jgi:hypothetical protein